jgi:hypothetical protein
VAQVLSLATGKPHDNGDMLAVIDDLRARIVAGDVVAFVAAGLDKADMAMGWSGATGGVSRLRMMGAIANLQHQYHAGALGDES